MIETFLERKFIEINAHECYIFWRFFVFLFKTDFSMSTEWIRPMHGTGYDKPWVLWRVNMTHHRREKSFRPRLYAHMAETRFEVGEHIRFISSADDRKWEKKRSDWSLRTHQTTRTNKSQTIDHLTFQSLLINESKNERKSVKSVVRK